MHSLLARAVRDEVVPRLLLAQRAAHPLGCDDPVIEPGIPPEDVVALVALAMTGDAETTVAFVDSIRARGTPLERIYLDLLAPAARRIGQLWVEDLCSFADVTVALARLQRVVRELSPAFQVDARATDSRRRAALVSMPGEQHTFGLFMVAEFFQRAGWDVWSEPVGTEAELASLVAGEWFAVVGLSVGCDQGVGKLPAIIRSVRRASRNRDIGVMVGGRVFAENPDLATMVGADATATDGRQAALQAETLLALLPSRVGR
jgi:methanogenic corrinoid protein MtbC1